MNSNSLLICSLCFIVYQEQQQQQPPVPAANELAENSNFKYWETDNDVLILMIYYCITL